MPETHRPKGRLLLVEDDENLVFALEDRLEREGHTFVAARDGLTAVEMASSRPFDCIILDVALPKMDGFEVCHELRRRNVRTPILMLTARGEIQDRVKGLRLGADDYLTKPFATIEMIARIEALLRRAPATAVTDTCSLGDVEIDFRGSAVHRRGVPIQLSQMEMRLLRYLVERRGIVVSREELLDKLWGHAESQPTRTIDVHIASLRQKLERNPSHPEMILTVYGSGYTISEAG